MKKILLSLMIAMAVVALLVSCSSEAKTYKVGDTGPAGGIIFYVNPNAAEDGWTYLEAAPTNAGSDANAVFEWGPTGSTGATGTAIGTGKSNTRALVALSGSYPAAEECDSYSKNGYDDWFLPSKDEMAEMAKYQIEIGIWVENSGQKRYWSSSEYNSADYAYYYNFGNSLFSNYISRTDTLPVRPIRSF